MFGGDNPVPLVLRTQGGHGLRLRVAAPDGPGGHLRHLARLADHGRVHPVRLRRADERGPGAATTRCSCSSTSTCTGPRARSRSATWTTRSPSARRRCAGQGSEVTVLSYLSMVAHAAEAIEQHRDRRRADRPALARPGLARLGDRRRVDQKTNAVLIVEQGALGTSYGGWLADEVQRRFFDWLDQPVQRVHGTESSPSASRKVLERAAIAGTEEVVGRARSGSATGSSEGAGLMATVVRMPAVLAGRDRGRDRALARRRRATRSRSGTPIAEIETEKALVEYAAEEAGVVGRLVLGEGDSGEIGDPIAVLVAAGETDADIDAALGGPGRGGVGAGRRTRAAAGARRRRARPVSAARRRRAAPAPTRASAAPRRDNGHQAPARPAGGSSPARWCASSRASGASTSPRWRAPGRTGGSCGVTWSASWPRSLRRARGRAAPRQPRAAWPAVRGNGGQRRGARRRSG